MQPTVLVVSFNEALDPASAENLSNYAITDPAHRSVRINSAVFDAATDTVTLRPADRINLHHTYHLNWSARASTVFKTCRASYWTERIGNG